MWLDMDAAEYWLLDHLAFLVAGSLPLLLADQLGLHLRPFPCNSVMLSKNLWWLKELVQSSGIVEVTREPPIEMVDREQLAHREV